MPDGSAKHDGRDTIGGCVLLEVHWDSCTVRATTKESRYSQASNLIHSERRKPDMADKDTIFVLSREDVVGCASEMGIPEEAITDDILAQVKKGVEWGLECWSEVVNEVDPVL